jgi:hypothetical protein
MSWLHPLLHHIAVQTGDTNLHRKDIFCRHNLADIKSFLYYKRCPVMWVWHYIGVSLVSLALYVGVSLGTAFQWQHACMEYAWVCYLLCVECFYDSPPLQKGQYKQLGAHECHRLQLGPVTHAKSRCQCTCDPPTPRLEWLPGVSHQVEYIDAVQA